MGIGWFPGHMAKAMRMMEREIALVDCVVYVLDARVPSACRNPGFAPMIADKPVLYLLNKSDLADPSETAKWIEALTDGRAGALALSATAGKSASAVIAAIRAQSMARIDKWAQKGVAAVPRAMVVGIPNTGKSAVVNLLCGGARAVTGDRPGVTRGKQWVRVGGVIDLLDTPGTLPKRFDDERVARHLAYVAGVREEVVDVADLSLHLIEELLTIAPRALSDRYGIAGQTDESAPTALAVLEAIAAARGYKLRGGDPDYDRAAAAVLDDFRKGRLGRITLERAVRADLP